ncbi:MAG TPA: FAD-binding oxidoreductase, partial [Gemmatimonadaceae bacterium]|nr:FAD-binding oxidoreductase [Gemmatimonadaceae bacterium]
MADDPIATVESPSALRRRDFIRVAGAGAGMMLLGPAASAEAAATPEATRSASVRPAGASPDVVVIGAGIWGSFTAYHLRKAGVKVTLVDAYGPGNARSTSGDESRGVRSSYGDRPGTLGELWMLWAREAMQRWRAFDDEWGRDLRLNLFHVTGDLILREDWDNFQLRCKLWWDRHKIPYEVLNPEDVRRSFPVISMDDITAVLHEPDAGVVRARRGAQAVSAAFEHLGGKIVIGRATPSKIENGRLVEIALDTGATLRADTFVYAVGAWLGKTFPELFAKKMRVPIGYVCYYATPVGDERFTYPNLPSFNFPGVTGWPALPVDNRGFRVRGTEHGPRPPEQAVAEKKPATADLNAPAVDVGSNAANAGGGGVSGAKQSGQAQAEVPPQQLDPDTSDRWANQERLDGSRRFVAHRFPLLKDAPIAQTHACHYEITSSGNFIIDHHPELSNVWIAAGGNAEGFKFGPKIGDYVAQRVLGVWADASVNTVFKIPEKEFEPPKP